MSARLLTGLTAHVESFLAKWTEGMDKAGYLKYTTAKRQDCIQSFIGVLGPLLRYLEAGGSAPTFADFLKNKAHWAEFIIAEARRHRFRGVTAEMFLGCFKTFIHAIEEIIREQPAPAEEKLTALEILRLETDALETLFLGDWIAITEKDAARNSDETNRRLTLEKNKYENIFTATSDLVLITNTDGLITEANVAAKDCLGHQDLIGHLFWGVLNLEGHSISEVIRYYHPDAHHEVSLFSDSLTFSFHLIPLKKVSLASSGYMILLTNVSCLVKQRECLERTVSQRTMALANSEKRYAALFQAAGEGILLVDPDFRVVEANDRGYQIFDRRADDPRVLYCRDLCEPHAQITLEQAIKNLDEHDIWSGQMDGLRPHGDRFPMAVTINRVDLDTGTFFLLLVRDITEQKAMEDGLRAEKEYQEEMNITLRHVLKSIDRERNELKRELATKIQTFILRPLEKVQNEPLSQVRNGYLELVRNQISDFCQEHGLGPNSQLLKLTPTEFKVCQFIKSGQANKDIADSLHLSVETVQTHRKNIRKKLGLKGREASLFSFLLSPNSPIPSAD